MNDHAKVDVSKAPDESVEARRNALRKMGLFAAYSTPVILGVLTPRKAMASSGPREHHDD